MDQEAFVIRCAPLIGRGATPVPRTLTRQTFDTPQSRPAYAPPRPRFDAAPPESAKHVSVDEGRINREYLRALLADMKLDLQ